MNAIRTTSWRRNWKALCISGVCAALAAMPATAQVPDESNVAVTDYGTVTLTVKDTDLHQVLEMLAIQSRKNIIANTNVSATVSANLYDVTFYEALDAILRVNGYGYLEEGNFIYVYSQSELDEIERQQRKTESRVFELTYLSAADANDLIMPLLSEAGTSSFRGDVAPGFKPDISDGGADSFAFSPMLVVNDYVDNLDDIAELLKAVDTQPKQVLVEATIVQSSLDESNAYGVDWAIVGNLNFTDLTNPLSVVDDLIKGNQNVPGSDIEANGTNGFQPGDNRGFGTAQSVGNTAGPAGLKVGLVWDDISVFLRVLDEVTDNTVLARPKIMCLNRQRAEVLVGARVGYLSTTATETTTTQTVEFLDTGIHLVFRPFVSDNGNVRMELAPSVSEASLRTITDANGLIVTIPDELTNELTTNVLIPEGQTLILGGLFRESTRTNRRQVPFLGDIPLVGPALFSGQDDSVDRDEIIFLITPSIVETESLEDIGEEMLAYADAIRIGARRNLLPFSREKMTATYNKDAVAAFQRGDTEKALYHINNSLRLNPVQPQMIKFREQVTGVKENLGERSLMDRVLRRELGMLIPEEPAVEIYVSTPIVPDARAYRKMAIARPQFQVPGTVASSATDVPISGQPAVTAEATPASDPVAQPSPLSIEQAEFYDDLFRTFFENLGVPELNPAVDEDDTAAADQPAFPFQTFEDGSVEVVEAPESGSESSQSPQPQADDSVEVVEAEEERPEGN